MDQKFLYFSKFHFHVLRSVLNRQRLIIPQPNPSSTNLYHRHSCFYDFKITRRYKDEWKQLMQIRDNDSFIPFTYHWPWAIKGLVENLLPILGLNLKNYLHVGQKVAYLNEYSTSNRMRYTNWNALVDLCAIGKDKMIIVSESSVHDQSGTPIVKTTDYSLVLNMTPDEVEYLSTLAYCNQSDITMLSRQFRKRRSLLTGDRCKYKESFYCDESIGIQYGCVSGALNTTHTFKTISPLFGHKRPFLQGMCTGNIILSLICMRLKRKMDRFEVYFNNKLFVPQIVELRFNESEFELFDSENTLVSFGTYHLAE